MAFLKIQNGGPKVATEMKKEIGKINDIVNKCARCNVEVLSVCVRACVRARVSKRLLITLKSILLQYDSGYQDICVPNFTYT